MSRKSLTASTGYMYLPNALSFRGLSLNWLSKTVENNRLYAFWNWFTLLFETTVSQAEIKLRFDGPEVQAHEMDVTLLGPSLFALGELCAASNQILNGPNTKIQVKVRADVKSNCVTIDLHLVQTVWQQVSDLIGNRNIVTAEEILIWIGLISGGTATCMEGAKFLIEFLKWKKDKKEQSAEVQSTPNGNIIKIQIEGNNNTVLIAEPVYKLSKSPKVVESVKMLTRPISEETGIHSATFIHDKKEHLKIDTESAAQLQEAHADSDETEPQIFTAHIVVYGVTLDPKSKHWKFKINNKVENLDISETKIAQEAVERGGVWVGDTYKVKVEMIERAMPNGGYKTDFKVKEVLEFRPGNRATQVTLL
jgi:hypothetical protein